MPRSTAGSLSRRPPATLTKTSWSSTSQAGALSEHRQEQRHAVAGSTPAHGAAADPAAAGATRAWTSTRSGRAPIERGDDDRADRRAPSRALGEPRALRSGWGSRSGRGRASRTRRSPAVSQSGSCARAGCDRRSSSPSKLSTTSTRCSSVRGPARLPSLVTWPTSTTGTLRGLGEAEQVAGALADLREVAGQARLARRCRPSGSSRPIEHARSSLCAGAGDLADGRIEDRRRSRPAATSAWSLGRGADPADAQRGLSDRLFAGRVEHHVAGCSAKPGQHLQQQGRLADARLAADQDQRARDQPTAEHPIELAEPRAQPRPPISVTSAMGIRAAAPAPVAHRWRRAASARERAPLLARSATSTNEFLMPAPAARYTVRGRAIAWARRGPAGKAGPATRRWSAACRRPWPWPWIPPTWRQNLRTRRLCTVWAVEPSPTLPAPYVAASLWAMPASGNSTPYDSPA